MLSTCCRWAAATLLVLASLLFGRADAQPLQLLAQSQPVQLGAAGHYWIDTTGRTPVQQVAGAVDIPWQATHAGVIYRMPIGSVLWIRFQVAPTRLGERWYLEVPHPGINLVTLYGGDPGSSWSVQRAGDHIPVADWPLPNRHPLLPLAEAPDGVRSYLLRVDNSRSFAVNLQFVNEGHLLLHEQTTSLLLGVYFGLALLAVLLTVAGGITLGDRTWWLFSLSVTLMTLAQAGVTGMAGLHLWPHSPWWNDAAPQVLSLLAAGAAISFFASVVSLRARSPWLYRTVLAVSLLTVPAAGVLLWMEPTARLPLLGPYAAFALVLGVGIVVWAGWRGDRYAWWLLGGILPVVAAGFLALARGFGMVPISFWTTHGMQIGVALELPILLVMLARRSQQRRDYSRRIHRLDRIDPATGLINAAVFHERLVRLIARSVRFKYRSAILLVDIVNLPQVRREFDRQAAQEMPLQVAGRLLSAAREIDSVARLDEHRFGLLLEGPLKAAEVAEAAPRIVARCLLPYRDKPLGWAPQVRVAQALIPKDGTDPDQLVARLEALLASVAPDTKRNVFMASRPDVPTSVPLSL